VVVLTRHPGVFDRVDSKVSYCQRRRMIVNVVLFSL
jgi:hypothetical protein